MMGHRYVSSVRLEYGTEASLSRFRRPPSTKDRYTPSSTYVGAKENGEQLVQESSRNKLARAIAGVVYSTRSVVSEPLTDAEKHNCNHGGGRGTGSKICSERDSEEISNHPREVVTVSGTSSHSVKANPQSKVSCREQAITLHLTLNV